jgi:VWFA-related protein
MKSELRFAAIFLAVLLCAPITLHGQSNQAQPAPGANAPMSLDVVVTDKSGAPVSGLEPGAFKLLDNGQPQALSVQPANRLNGKADPPVEAFLVIDGINQRFLAVANERQWLPDFFKQNGGELALPTSLVILTEKGIDVQNHPTRDGKALQQFLDANATGFRFNRNSEGWEGYLARENESLKDLHVLALELAKKPGRKLVIWIGGGWGVTSNPSSRGSLKRMGNIYTYISSLSTALREARITLDQVVLESSRWGGGGRTDTYVQYVKGIDNPKNADLGGLALSVLATQSGGQVLYSDDLATQFDRCIADAKAYYVLTYTPPAPSHADEYHRIEVLLDKPGLKARTRTGYYTASAEGTGPGLSLQ